ncbi:MAG: HD domain-containing protein [Candidatus Aminicenantes bacterium]|nr:HD domain-containing protein [Candidatus Aminicenantes bacterium]
MDIVAERKGPPRFSSLIANEKEKDKALTYPSTEKELDLYASKEVGQQDLFSLDTGSMEVIKMSLVKRMLRHLGNSYGNIFENQAFDFEEEDAEKEAFLNSSLLYYIAATDGNEDTVGHSQLVARYTIFLAKTVGIEDKNSLINIERGALLHDIGKIGIPEFILRKAGSLTEIEREIVQEHPFLGYGMIEEFDFLKEAAQIVLFHHESYSGDGYPFGLRGEEIPLEARIFALADTLDAITSDRTYREGRSFDEAYREIEKNQGSQFDPLIVEVLLSIPKEEWQNIKAETKIILPVHSVH